MKPTFRKIILFAILVVAIIVLAVLVLSKKETNTDMLQTTSLKPTTNTDNSQSGKFLQSLSQVQSINLDTTFFNNKSYQRLVDFSITTVIEDPRLIGRPNPFAPLGADSIINTPTNNTTPIIDPNAKKTN